MENVPPFGEMRQKFIRVTGPAGRTHNRFKFVNEHSGAQIRVMRESLPVDVAPTHYGHYFLAGQATG